MKITVCIGMLRITIQSDKSNYITNFEKDFTHILEKKMTDNSTLK